MRPNPGGEISPSEILGRDALINEIWSALEVQSVILTAERRIGKTSIIKKMKAEARGGKRLVYRDLENINTPAEFVETVFEDIEQYLTMGQRATNRTKRFLQSIGGAEVKGFRLPQTAAPHWKQVLAHLIEDLDEHHPESLIFLWDELPMMLQNIQRQAGEAVAMEMFDTLRHLRQSHKGLRMVYTGSIGLHHVLASLKKSGYVNAPTNDMLRVDVPAIDEPFAVDLASKLLDGANVAAEDGVSAAIAVGVDNVPFYIHHTVQRLSRLHRSITTEIVHEVITAALTDPQNPWDMYHYIERVQTYYEPADQPVAYAILDSVAESTSLSTADLFRRLQATNRVVDQEALRRMLTLLQRDHYIIMQADSAFRFAFPLIQRFWNLQRSPIV